MHEESLVRSLVEDVAKLRDAHCAAQVSSVWLEIGPLSGVEPDLLHSAFERLAPARLGRLVRLELIWTPLALDCARCGARSSCDAVEFSCRQCGSREVAIRGGDRVIMDRVELVFEEGPQRGVSATEVCR